MSTFWEPHRILVFELVARAPESLIEPDSLYATLILLRFRPYPCHSHVFPPPGCRNPLTAGQKPRTGIPKTTGSPGLGSRMPGVHLLPLRLRGVGWRSAAASSFRGQGRCFLKPGFQKTIRFVRVVMSRCKGMIWVSIRWEFPKMRRCNIDPKQ